MPEIFIRKIEPGELKYFGGGEISSTCTGKYPFNWERFKSMAWGQLQKIRESDAFSEQNMTDVNGILGELVRRNKSPLHPLYQNAASLLAERLPAAGIVCPQLLSDEIEV